MSHVFENVTLNNDLDQPENSPKSTKSFKVNVTGLYSAYFSMIFEKSDEEPPATFVAVRRADLVAYFNKVSFIA